MSRNGSLGNYAKGIIGSRVARIAASIVALVFVGGFWLLNNIGVVETNETTAILGVVLYIVIAFPIALLAGRASDKALGRKNRTQA